MTSWISRLIPIKEDQKIFFFRLEDESGTIKVKASGEDAEKFYLLIQEGEIYNMQFAEIVVTTKPNSIYPFKYEMIILQQNRGYIKIFNNTLITNWKNQGNPSWTRYSIPKWSSPEDSTQLHLPNEPRYYDR